ncbi:MAG: type II secretion system F family protein [Butyrivibrio sp.]|nr:type II secretion system F family protein [Butyrivibrio sp.]
MPIYYVSNMTKIHKVAVFIISALVLGFLVFMFYHLIFVSIPVGILLGVPAEKLYERRLIKQRQKKFRAQFKDFLESMAVAVRAGNVDYQAIKYARTDLSLIYNETSDIIMEIDNIINKYEKGGIKISELFRDIADRSGVEDAADFASVYEVIEGKSDRFEEILTHTRDVIAEKCEIEQEIETVVTEAKSEAYVMLVMPFIILAIITVAGAGLMDTLFTTMNGRIAATIALAMISIAAVITVLTGNVEV